MYFTMPRLRLLPQVGLIFSSILDRVQAVRYFLSPHSRAAVVKLAPLRVFNRDVEPFVYLQGFLLFHRLLSLSLSSVVNRGFLGQSFDYPSPASLCQVFLHKNSILVSSSYDTTPRHTLEHLYTICLSMRR